ncbi:MAG TPA: RagB/SusD family nutrient uptake outer membrane protein [Gemmatimonadaceae bacterium]|nr:RagB/SusD family nutrient uptake outer membrane protein [Gemmatimonadaceae bacterium]
MKQYSMIAFAVALVAAGCKDNPVANPIDAPTVDALSGGLTRTSLQQLATGVTAQDRAGFATSAYLIIPEVYARDVYRIDASEPRWVLETLAGNPDPGSFAGGGGFTDFFVGIRSANTILLSLQTPDPSQFSAAEADAARGFFRTMKALDYYRLIELRDTVGIPIQTDDPAAVTDIRCKTAVLGFIAALLDSANADLTAAGGATSLPFKLPTGFSAFGRDYNVVSNLILFNRGLKGKVDFYRALDRTNPQAALFQTAINELTQALGGAAPGAVPASQLSVGVYYKFVPGGSENFANIRSDSKIGLNPLVIDSVQAGDTRGSKVVSRTVLAGNGLSTTITFSGSVPTPANEALPIALLKDEELVLLRAQAEIGAGQLAAATLDINSVRTTYGLPPYAVFTTQAAAIDAVLYEKRFSLLFEGPQRLVDLRGYGRLNGTYFRQELPTDPFNAAMPIPRAELNARGLTTNPACTP